MPQPSFQNLILDLQRFWADYGCVLLQPYTLEVGAGTSHPATLLRSLGVAPWQTAYVQPCCRPNDGRYGENPNRMQQYYQFQTFLKPAPVDSQTLYLKSLEAVGFDVTQHDIRFVEDDWENPSLGAAGLGWEIWCDGMEITQYTYFQQVGGIECDVIPVEITYGLERVALFLQNSETFFDLNWNGGKGDKKFSYKDVYFRQEVEFSKYNFELANTEILLKNFNDAESECQRLLDEGVVLPAYDSCLRANHFFNMLNARGVISTAERASFIARVRALAKSCCEVWRQSQEPVLN
ncbi:glycine--tRNA ligase alpha subunit [Alphaproteobacteria bacterium]|nr:glycine--tRNA ligase alpha subunit [Alphaproteobacteria bacterium]GHT00399.1 glycine--tRNA ligase alpha subunit [Alphaproteobacteria bacterium]